MTKNELRELLESDMAAVLAEVVAASDGRELDLTAIEELALEARQKFGAGVAQRLVEQQVDRHEHELPPGAGGKSMHPKGKKTKRS